MPTFLTARGRAAVLLVLLVATSTLFILRSENVSLTWTRYKSGTLASLATYEASPCISKLSDSRVDWSNREIPQTTLQVHITGWSVLNNLYALNGTLYVVTDDPGAFPPLREMTSTGVELDVTEENVAAREPTDEDMRIIGTEEALALFGHSASRLGGVTMICNDPDQFLGHYYHFTAEVFLGLWRTYSSLDLHITADGNTVLPPVSRIIFPHSHVAFHDYAGVNHVVLRAAFPAIAVEYEEDWLDRASTARPMLMDRVVLTARSATERARDYHPDDKMIAVADRLPKSPFWWSPIRRQVLEFVGAPKEETIAARKPVITYISRQSSLPAWGRKLARDAHRGLVDALRGLEARYGYEVNVAEMENMSKTEQIKLAARTTIMIGVHGNGLSSLLWMQPSPSATVIEIYFPSGFSNDYYVPARVLGIEHYGVWGDRYFRTESEHKPQVNQPEGFHRDQIPVDGPTVAALCVERINHPTLLLSKL